MTRKYELKKRAERQEETRRRIVDAAVALHGELGPARTSISGIAERAGVERLTVYRHFANEREIFAACSARYSELNPRPDIKSWVVIVDPTERLSNGLAELYAYYTRAEGMLVPVLRDAPLVPAMREPFARFEHFLEAAVEVLRAGWPARKKRERQFQAALRLAIDFQTWRLMVREQGLSPEEAVDTQVRMVSCLAK
jgi:AcrR family transcriptional regulator